MLCAFTGHRPEKLPWGEDESDLRCVALKVRISQTIRFLVNQGFRDFACGMARGCDFYFAEAVFAAQLWQADVRLYAFLPCSEQANCWNAADRKRYEIILKKCSKIYMVEQHYSEGCMLRRNRAMLNCADRFISVYDGSGGGTGAAVRYAERIGIPITPLWL
ncbi:MAG: DUF1273 domain-containing protein [Oscillospiraceae bacterium]|nr:DUF1273 domain-containing protein [Oscillospiraceae bacterium]